MYLNQFLKVLKSLLKQLIALKGFDRSHMQISSADNLKEGLNGSKHSIKLVFLPVAEMDGFRDALNEIKTALASSTDPRAQELRQRVDQLLEATFRGGRFAQL